MAKRFTAISVEGEIQVHAIGGPSDHASLCGIDGDDPAIHQHIVPLPKKPKINCPQCLSLVQACRQYRLTDFDLNREY